MILKILNVAIILCAIVVVPFSLYHFFVGLYTFKKTSKVKDTDKINKFAILVAARNEESVIGDLIDSLRNLDYPKDSYDIYIAPNNCRDNTRGVCEEKGVNIFDVTGVIRSKGDVLHQMFNYLLEHENHDAYVIFDADNLVDRNFLKEMNKQIEAGYSAVQGFRDSKNPYESITSGCYTIFHYMVATFYNKPRTTLKINNMIIGCGFMVTNRLLKMLGGWNTKTITEDLEFTVLTTLEGERIGYSENAIFYDEQPNSFIDSWHQRIRWQLGLQQGFVVNAKNVVKYFFKKTEVEQIDKIAMLSANYVANISLVSLILASFIIALETTYKLGLAFFGLNILGAVFGGALFAMFILKVTKKKIKPMWKGVLGFGVFLLSWIPINLYVMFKDDVEWREIKHGTNKKYKGE